MTQTRNLPADERPDLDTVLFDYACENEKPSTKAARRWIFAYPYYRQEIAEFTAGWVCMELFDEPETRAAVETDEIVLLHASKIDEILQQAQH